MSTTHRIPATARWVGGGIGLAAAAYLAQAGWSWLRFGVVPAATAAESEPLLDAFMPDYDVVERHHVHVAAPAAVTVGAAREIDLTSPVASALFKVRELVLGGTPDERPHPRGLLDQLRSIGWEVLAEVPDREIVLGAIGKPWNADPGFRAVAPGFFAGFNEPGYVKIAWTLRADPVADDACILRTETRAVATDPFSRARFRRYWSFVSPGVRLIRHALMGPVKEGAERRARASRDA